ncbi:hypothetical protein [Myroides sp. LoEW2-1]|uniref:hypothetical protein n=1 Tax=Myroides sp. LoEW2-1 TaxID=2683192 RepID=UPI0013297B1A|nr:hypothetical protein [Myroides sp. LoEW2-1]MVX35020.1 hypothetical protein [Myroides sp. LoEW2-1]
MSKFYLNIFLLAFVTTFSMYAQPGFTGQEMRGIVGSISKRIAEDSLNVGLRISRLDLTFNSAIDLHTKGNVRDENGEKLYSKMSYLGLSFEELMDDINFLIHAEQNGLDGIKGVKYILRRGLMNFYLGNYENALDDYMKALVQVEKDPTLKDSKESVYKHLAIYYYNLAKHESVAVEQNLEQSLEYVEKLSTIELNYKATEMSKQYMDRYETWKEELLTTFHYDERLEAYYKVLLKEQYRFFTYRYKYYLKYYNKDTDTDSDRYQSNRFFKYTLNYANKLAILYIKQNRLSEAEYIVNQCLKYFPQTKSGYILDGYSVNPFYYTLSSVYRTDSRFDEELDALINAFSMAGGRIQFDLIELENYLNEKLVDHPKEPRLYLLLANCKVNYSISNHLEYREDEILNLLTKAEKLGYKKAQLYYLRATIYLHSKDSQYKKGLIAIEKALKLDSANPSLQLLKYYIVRRLPSLTKQHNQFLTMFNNYDQPEIINNPDISDFINKITEN